MDDGRIDWAGMTPEMRSYTERLEARRGVVAVGLVIAGLAAASIVALGPWIAGAWTLGKSIFH